MDAILREEAKPVNLEYVSIYTGSANHVVDRDAPPVPGQVPERAPALCGARPLWPGMWQLGMDKPTCRQCERALEARSATAP